MKYILRIMLNWNHLLITVVLYNGVFQTEYKTHWGRGEMIKRGYTEKYLTSSHGKLLINATKYSECIPPITPAKQCKHWCGLHTVSTKSNLLSPKHPEYLWTGEALQYVWGLSWVSYTSFSAPKPKITTHSRLLNRN